ncbi:Hypothetical_protein [Hexamita inflata]|uniref:Hypothetical_protein n=1 Tax=Hexamita inflata TaxID=28002 RepID=A0AA86NAP2_9EUKA|nr:Hypothetical protein HINF_LOCUS3882 [Hexamita inflata]
MFDVEANKSNVFKVKILKYRGTYDNNRILLALYYKALFEKSVNMLSQNLVEKIDLLLSENYCFAVARTYEEAKMRYTSLIINVLREGTIMMKYSWRDHQATEIKAPQNIDDVGARLQAQQSFNHQLKCSEI